MKTWVPGRETRAGAANRSTRPGTRSHRSREGGEPLPQPVRDFFEPRFGHDFSRVRIYADGRAANAASALNAHAFTVGQSIVFGQGEYAPETAQGNKLLAHELTHVVQQEGSTSPAIMRKAKECPPALAPEPNYKRLARRVNEGIEYTWGTDEEKVYRGLRPLERDPGRICKLKEVYQQEYGASLLEDIEGDFSDEELEYALQLLNQTEGGFAQRVQAAPITSSGYLAEARRLYEAGPDMTMRTDEEAIFAVLTPLAGKPGMKLLEQTYKEEYHHSLRWMLEDEMEGSELDYALELLDMPVAGDKTTEDLPQDDPAISTMVQEAYDKLAKDSGVGFGVWWERKEDGSARYDERYWEFKGEKAYKEGTLKAPDAALTLKPGIDPHVAVDAIFDQSYRWEMDCGQFVQIARLYVQRKLIPDDTAFDEWATPDLTLRTHAPETFRHALFLRAHEDGLPLDRWITKPSGRIDVLSEERMLASAPSGSRVRWTSSWTKQAAKLGESALPNVSQLTWYAFQNENAIKIGPDRYAAHGLGTVSAKELVTDMVDATRQALGAMAPLAANTKGAPDLPSNPSDDEIKQRIYVDNVEYYRWKE